MLFTEGICNFLLFCCTRVMCSRWNTYSKEIREPGELLAEIILLMDSTDEEPMTVTELRRELDKRELDVDGSKVALVERLNNAKRQRTE